MSSPDEVDASRLHDVLLELSAGLAERFPEREPTEDEVRAFIEEHLRSTGRSEQEINEALAALDD